MKKKVSRGDDHLINAVECQNGGNIIFAIELTCNWNATMRAHNSDF